MGQVVSAKLIFGFHPVREVLRHSPERVERVYSSAQGKRLRAVVELAQQSQVPVEKMSAGELDRTLEGLQEEPAEVANRVHNGFVARLKPCASVGTGLAHPDNASVANPGAVDRELIVLLEDVQDPRNLGAILRVCEGAGVSRVLIRDRGSAPISATAIKASAGAAEYVAYERYTNTAQQLERLKDQGFWCYGADAEGVPPWEVDLCGPVVICLGGEGRGLRPRTRALCDGLVGLPMRGRVDSLNVATAASALLYEAVRQRLVAPART